MIEMRNDRHLLLSELFPQDLRHKSRWQRLQYLQGKAQQRASKLGAPTVCWRKEGPDQIAAKFMREAGHCRHQAELWEYMASICRGAGAHDGERHDDEEYDSESDSSDHSARCGC